MSKKDLSFLYELGSIMCILCVTVFLLTFKISKGIAFMALLIPAIRYCYLPCKIENTENGGYISAAISKNVKIIPIIESIFNVKIFTLIKLLFKAVAAIVIGGYGLFFLDVLYFFLRDSGAPLKPRERISIDEDPDYFEKYVAERNGFIWEKIKKEIEKS